MKLGRILGAAALLGLGFVGDATASSHSEAPGTSNRAAPSMEPFGTFWLHVGGGVGMTRNTTFRDQDCNSPNAFFGCDFNASGDFGDSGAVINLGVGTPLGGPFRGAIELFHGNNFQFEGPLVDTSAFSSLNAAAPGINEIFHADAQFTKVELWVYLDIHKVVELPRYVQPFVGVGGGVTRNRLSNVHSKVDFVDVESGSFNLRADLPGGTETNFTWGVTGGVSIPLDGPNGPVIDFFFLYQDLGQVSTRSGDATIQINSPFGSSSGTFPVDPVQADLAVQVIGARARFPLSNLFGN
jgi:hypothetical protein